MIQTKNEQQIEGIRKSCKMLSTMFREILPLVKTGVQTIELDRWVRKWIKQAGGQPAFLGYGSKQNPFPGAICISINEEVIHGIPGKRRIVEGDLVSLDCGINLGGYISDQAITVEVGKVEEEFHRLNVATRECLALGLGAVKRGDRLLQIARAVYGHASSLGYGVVRDFCGHGVGLEVHEDPSVPNYPHGPNPKMTTGLVIAIEPMINLGTGDVKILNDGWTVVTADRRRSSHWEHTVAILPDRTEVLTEDILELSPKTQV
jgi:methionyl aminopeptidase